MISTIEQEGQLWCLLYSTLQYCTKHASTCSIENEGHRASNQGHKSNRRTLPPTHHSLFRNSIFSFARTMQDRNSVYDVTFGVVACLSSRHFAFKASSIVMNCVEAYVECQTPRHNRFVLAQWWVQWWWETLVLMPRSFSSTETSPPELYVLQFVCKEFPFVFIYPYSTQ